MTDPLTLYKLIVLYMLDRVDFPLIKAQIFDFVLEKEYANYFTIQQVISELTDAGLISSKSVRNSSHLSISPEGHNTLTFFASRISDTIRNEIDEYFKENSLDLRNEVSVQSDFYKTTVGDFAAHLIVKERNVNLIDLTVTVPTEDAAIYICDNWQKKNQEVYAFIMEQLM